MSGILLPGQENQPQPDAGEQPSQEGSGLILPSGYSSTKEKPAPKEVQATPEPSPSQSAPQPPEPGNRQPQQPQMDLTYPPSGAQVQCPNCGTAYTTPIFTIIDLGADPMLKGPLLGGQINTATCPSCNASGQLSVPLMLHVPEEEFLAVYVPQGGGLGDLQGQKVIGDLTQALMRNTPKEERKGYMLQPQQFIDWNRLLEKVWGFDGVTPEMLRRQREQSTLMQSLLRIGNDDSALKIAVERSSQLIDRDFFGLLEQLAMNMGSQGQSQAAQGILVLYEKLLTMSDAGKEIAVLREKIQGILGQITSQTTRSELLDLILSVWKDNDEEDGDQIVNAVVMQVGQAFDYEFLMELASRIEKASEDEKEKLSELRELILALQEQQKQGQEAMVQQLQAILQEVLQAPDTEAALRQHAQYIDENFLGILGANIQAAQQKNAGAAVQRLQSVYQQAVTIFQEKLPPEVRLIQELMAAPDSGSVRKLLKENRSLVTKDLVDNMSLLENQMREADRPDQADQIKSLRGQVALMV
ncbi:MAG: CpXC domain-containing protein [Chloroflexota bacterium]